MKEEREVNRSFPAPLLRAGAALMFSCTLFAGRADGFSCEAPSVPNEVRVTSVDPRGATSVVVRVEVPIRGIDEMWFPDRLRPVQERKWWMSHLSAPQRNFPFVSYFASNGENALSFGASSLAYDSEMKSKINQEKGVFELTLAVTAAGEAIRPFKVTVDRRPGDWTLALAAWRDGLGYAKGPFPDAAWKPVYCSWYAVHAAFTQHWVDRTACLAADLGFKTFILDDGWSYDEQKRVNPETIVTWYRDIGRWDAFSKAKFPDFKAHRERMRRLGLKYLVWVAPYFIGSRTPLYREGGFEARGEKPFEGNVLADVTDSALMNKIDDQLVRLLRDNDLDGLKIDFLDAIPPSCERPRAAAVRSYVESLLKRLKAVKPDGLFEFRQGYATPYVASLGTQFRAGDVPFDWQANLLELAQIRLAMGDGVPIHADPIYYSEYETSDNIDRHFMATMAGVPMLSMDLERMSVDDRRRVRRWMDFYRTRVEPFQREGHWSVRYRNGALASVWAERGQQALALVNDSGFAPELERALERKAILLLNLTHEPLAVRGVVVGPAKVGEVP